MTRMLSFFGGSAADTRPMSSAAVVSIKMRRLMRRHSSSVRQGSTGADKVPGELERPARVVPRRAPLRGCRHCHRLSAIVHHSLARSRHLDVSPLGFPAFPLLHGGAHGTSRKGAGPLRKAVPAPRLLLTSPAQTQHSFRLDFL